MKDDTGAVDKKTIKIRIDETPPASIINPQAIAGSTYINFTWFNPPDLDFFHVMLYLNGTFRTNVSAPQNYYNVTNLTPNTQYELATRTLDASGNINQTWVNHTATTLSYGELRGDINRNRILDTGDATVILRYLVELPTPSEYLPLLPVGDMNCNDILDTGDATLILRDIVGLDIPRCWE